MQQTFKVNSGILRQRTKSLDALIRCFTGGAIPTGDLQDALSALLGKGAPNRSPSVISRLTVEWQSEYERWLSRNLANTQTIGNAASNASGRADADTVFLVAEIR